MAHQHILGYLVPYRKVVWRPFLLSSVSWWNKEGWRQLVIFPGWSQYFQSFVCVHACACARVCVCWSV